MQLNNQTTQQPQSYPPPKTDIHISADKKFYSMTVSPGDGCDVVPFGRGPCPGCNALGVIETELKIVSVIGKGHKALEPCPRCKGHKSLPIYLPEGIKYHCRYATKARLLVVEFFKTATDNNMPPLASYRRFVDPKEPKNNKPWELNTRVGYFTVGSSEFNLHRALHIITPDAEPIFLLWAEGVINRINEHKTQ